LARLLKPLAMVMVYTARSLMRIVVVQQGQDSRTVKVTQLPSAWSHTNRHLDWCRALITLLFTVGSLSMVLVTIITLASQSQQR
jgi:hypothetical protein